VIAAEASKVAAEQRFKLAQKKYDNWVLRALTESRDKSKTHLQGATRIIYKPNTKIFISSIIAYFIKWNDIKLLNLYTKWKQEINNR